MKRINFCAGPAILPPSVYKQAAEAVVDYKGLGLSLLEISHRTDWFDEIIHGARGLVADMMQLNDDYDVLFLTGGASSQFALVPFNLLPTNGTACYIDTGRWSDKAVKEAKLFGNVKVVASSAKEGYKHIPKNFELGTDCTYLHLTTNNTVSGTQMHQLPEVQAPIVADMSSDIFSKPMDGKDYGLIYAGAQKNVGAAGTTLVVIRKDLLGKVQRAIPTMLDYRTHIKHLSLFNTPPVFPIYCCYLTLQWVQAQGLETIAANNKAKADLIYNEIDRNGLFTGYTALADRSLMNATFVCTNPDLESTFLQTLEEAGCIGLKGHRSMGGFRASMYNAMDIAGVQVLVDVMQEFERKLG